MAKTGHLVPVKCLGHVTRKTKSIENGPEGGRGLELCFYFSNVMQCRGKPGVCII